MFSPVLQLQSELILRYAEHVDAEVGELQGHPVLVPRLGLGGGGRG